MPRGTSDILANYNDKLTQEQRRAPLKRIERATAYLDKMLDELSLIARGERGYLQFQPMLLSPHDLCADILNDFTTINESAHEIVLEGNELIEPCCLDEDMFRHIIVNLLSNAIKYSPEGSKIILRLSKQQSDLIFEVIDQGIGIPEEDIPRLFEPFHRAQNVGSTKGSGIGLSIVRELISAHGGQISCESNLGVGTTFTVTIPLNTEDCEKIAIRQIRNNSIS